MGLPHCEALRNDGLLRQPPYAQRHRWRSLCGAAVRDGTGDHPLARSGGNGYHGGAYPETGKRVTQRLTIDWSEFPALGFCLRLQGRPFGSGPGFCRLWRWAGGPGIKWPGA